LVEGRTRLAAAVVDDGGGVADIIIEKNDGYTVLRPTGELDAFTVAGFRQVLSGLAPSSSVVMDLTNVTFLDSAGLGALVGGIRRVREGEGSVAVASGRSSTDRVLRTAGIDRIVPLTDNVDEAVQALKESG
jgi:anti-sigma B factor antagonist